MHTKLLYKVAKVKIVSTLDVEPDSQPPPFGYFSCWSVALRQRYSAFESSFSQTMLNTILIKQTSNITLIATSIVRFTMRSTDDIFEGVFLLLSDNLVSAPVYTTEQMAHSVARRMEPRKRRFFSVRVRCSWPTTGKDWVVGEEPGKKSTIRWGVC